MPVASRVEVALWNTASIGKVLSALHSAGWQFWENEVRYCWYREVGEEEVAATAAPERWQELTAVWEEQCRLGKTVQLMYQWQSHADQVATVEFSWRQSGSATHLKMTIRMFPAWRRLCGSITDYSWYLSRLVCPLERNGCAVAWVNSHDDLQ